MTQAKCKLLLKFDKYKKGKCVLQDKNIPQLAGSSSLFGQLGVPSHTRDCSIQVPEAPQVKVVAVHLVGFKAK